MAPYSLKCKDITREKYNNECGTNMVGFDLPHCCDPIISTLLRLKRHDSFHCSSHLLKMHLFVIFFNHICQYTAPSRFVVEIHSINLFAFTVSLKRFTRISADYDETGVERGGQWILDIPIGKLYFLIPTQDKMSTASD